MGSPWHIVGTSETVISNQYHSGLISHIVRKLLVMFERRKDELKGDVPKYFSKKKNRKFLNSS